MELENDNIIVIWHSSISGKMSSEVKYENSDNYCWQYPSTDQHQHKTKINISHAIADRFSKRFYANKWFSHKRTGKILNELFLEKIQ